MGFEPRFGEAMDEAREHFRPVASGMAATAEGEIRRIMVASTPSGERYPDPEGGTYVASAPGEPPAVRTADYLRSYGHTDAIIRESLVVAAVTSDKLVSGGTPLWAILEFGTLRQEPRPHVRPSAEEAARGFRRAVRGAGTGGRSRELRRAA